MNTKRFRTRTEFIERNNGKIDGVWEIALDIGYSAVKGFSPSSINCFPSYIKRIDDTFQFAGTAPKESIVYKNLETNDMYLVGAVAQNIMSSGDTNDSEAMLYGRDRDTKVIAEVGLGLGCMSNEFGAYSGERIVVQTGLPERYMDDQSSIIESLAGEHHFALRIGNNAWQKFHFTIAEDDVYVMSQPKGSLFSVCINKDGRFHADAANYLSSSVLVFDPGFGTLDIFSIVAGTVGRGETFSDLGMKRVLQETTKLIKSYYKETDNINLPDIPVPLMQKYLESGNIRYENKKELIAKDLPFDKLLAQANNKVCEEAIARMAQAINLIDYNYMIVTGGTGAAWLRYIQEKFKNFSTLKILCANQNDDLPFIYSNVRGYYLYRFNKLGQKK